MLTKFGKELRMLRLEQDEILKQMAEKLEISPSYLSSIENGKKPITKTLLESIERVYNLNKKRYVELLNAAEITSNEITINTEGISERNVPIALKFARSFNDLSDDAINRINSILKEEEEMYGQ
ncbi:MAG: helix-turn-helix transcriptional regulator [Erysipelotrichaceae bacterium]|nr:helix-turn-helix transcriptional regulator [Erysipelotrichaceae bacterium]